MCSAADDPTQYDRPIVAPFPPIAPPTRIVVSGEALVMRVTADPRMKVTVTGAIGYVPVREVGHPPSPLTQTRESDLGPERAAREEDTPAVEPVHGFGCSCHARYDWLPEMAATAGDDETVKPSLWQQIRSAFGRWTW